MKILIAEDTEDSRVMLELVLAAQGFQVTSAANGLEALNGARQNPPDLIISDIMMPEMDGFDFCRKIKADPELKTIPFIFYTATYTDREDEELALALGAIRFLIKPLGPEVLIEVIHDVMDLPKNEVVSAPENSKKDGPDIEGMHLSSVSRKLDKKICELELEREALKKSEETYRQLVESVQDYYFFYTHDKEGSFSYISPSIETILGYKPEEFVKNFSKYLTENSFIEEIQNHFKTSAMTEEQPPYEIEIYHKDGSVHWLELKNIPVLNEKGHLLHVKGIAHDITDQKQAEELIRRGQKMNALGKLAGGIVHDYKNMLGVVLGYAELLEASLSDQPKLAGFAREIHRAGERGHKLSIDLMAFSQEKMSDAELVDFNSFLLDEKDMLEKSLTARIQLELDLESKLWPVWLDKSDLENAVLNLSLNALYAIDASGQLTIHTANKKIDNINARKLDLLSGDYVLLSITDTGCGMDNAIKDKIFDPFFSTKGEKGTGLGLSQVYGFIERSNGVIKVRSEKGRGTCFDLYFPRYVNNDSKTPKEIDSKIEKNMTDLNGKGTVLAVDDEPALLLLVSEILESHGYIVFCAENAKQALEIIDREVIDLLLSDVVMPAMDGYQLATIVQGKYPHTKVQLVSGFSDKHHKNIGDKSLHENLLHKPYNSQALLTRVRELLSE